LKESLGEAPYEQEAVLDAVLKQLNGIEALVLTEVFAK
jgi:hypothetical protein